MITDYTMITFSQVEQNPRDVNQGGFEREDIGVTGKRVSEVVLLGSIITHSLPITTTPSDSFFLTPSALQERYVLFVTHRPALYVRMKTLLGHPSAQGGNSTAQGRGVQAPKRVKLQRPVSGCSRMSPIMAPKSRSPFTP